MTHARILGVVSIAVIAGAFSSANADDLDARIAALERENVALKKQLRIRELEKKNAALREQLRSTSATRPKVAAPARPRPAAKRTAEKADGLAAVARALAYAPSANPPYPTKDPVPPAVYLPTTSWAGWYFGGHGGMGFGNWSLSESGNVRFTSTNSVSFFVNNSEASLNAIGAIGGIQTGYLWQVNQFVFGPELDISVGEIADRDSQIVTQRGSFTQQSSQPTSSVTTFLTQAASSVRWLSTLRGRIGLLADNWLFFGTGGLAIGGVDIWSDSPGLAKSRYALGYVAGGGFQYAIGPQLAFRTEYLHYGFPETTVTIDFTGGSTGTTTTSSTTTRLTPASHVIRAGLDVRLN